MRYSRLYVIGAAVAASSLAALLVAPLLVAAEGPEAGGAGRSGPENAAVRAAAGHMRRLKLERVDEAKKTIGLIDQPLLAFGDSTRATSEGTLWAWGDRGRPAAFLELYQIGGFEGQWFHAISLAAKPNVALEAPPALRWQPQTAQFPFSPLEESPEPSLKEAGRLRQLRDASRRFTAHEFWDPDNSRHELRILPQPLHRYRDPEENVQDGAVFAIVHGTNPEGMVLIEILERSIDSGRWQYAVLRSSDAEGHIELDGKEVRRWDRAVHTVKGLREPYCVFTTPQETSADEEPSQSN